MKTLSELSSRLRAVVTKPTLDADFNQGPTLAATRMEHRRRETAALQWCALRN